MPNFAELIEEKQTAPEQQIAKIQRLIGEIEELFTHRPLIVYAADINKTHPDVPNLIYPLDKTLFADLLDSVGASESIDVLLQTFRSQGFSFSWTTTRHSPSAGIGFDR